MKIGKIIGVLGVGALCVVTGGLAAPAIGAAVGGVMGLSGAAATSAGLAAIGGGSLAAGGLGMAGGTAIIQAVAGGVGVLGSKIAFSAADAASAKKENRELRDELKKSNIDNATKQKVITQLNAKIDQLKNELQKERVKADKNEETIKIIQEQIDDLYETLKVARAA